MSESKPPSGDKKVPARKSYARPVLKKYGSIRVITQDVGSKGNGDGGANPKTKSRA